MIYFVAFLGLVFGSFLNVLIYRLPNNKSIVRPASHCPNCQHKLAWYDNIPVVSYLLLGGKCRYCKKTISPRYLMVELINGGLWALSYSVFGFNGLMVLACVFISVCLVITFIDLEHMIIPDSMNIGILVVGIVLIFLPNRLGNPSLSITWQDQVIGFGFGIGFLLLMALIEKVFQKEVMGGGDLKMIAAVGLFLGWQLTILGIMLASIIGSLIEGVLRIAKLRAKNEPLPFGPYLVIGFLTSLFVGADLINWYLNLFEF